MSTGMVPRPVACAAGLAIAALSGLGAHSIPTPRLDLGRTSVALARPIEPAPIALVAPADIAPVPILEQATAIQPFEPDPAPTGAAGLRAKWRVVEQSIAADRRILARCRADRAGCPSAAGLRFMAIVDAARLKTGRARIGEVNRAINLSIRPMRDIDQYGVEDLWSSPLATLAAGAGDCEDYAIAKYVALGEAGMAEDDLRLAIVHDAGLGEPHAVVMARLDGRWLVLDNRWLALVEIERLTRYLPLFALGRDGVRPLALAELLPPAIPGGRPGTRL